jgi:hypothetical protein
MLCDRGDNVDLAPSVTAPAIAVEAANSPANIYFYRARQQKRPRKSLLKFVANHVSDFVGWLLWSAGSRTFLSHVMRNSVREFLNIFGDLSGAIGGERLGRAIIRHSASLNS